MTPELAAQKKRLVIMAIVNIAAAAVALGFLVVWAKLGADWAMAGFIISLLAGFGGQIWFIAGFRRRKGV